MKAETTPPPALAGMGGRIAHEMHAAALPAGIQHFGDGGFDAFVRVRDHELHATQAAAGELAQEGGPEHLGFRRADVHAQDFAPAVRVDTNGNNDGH